MTEIQQNMPEMLKMLEDQVNAKKNLLKSVFTELSEGELFKNQAQIRDVLGVTPVNRVNDGFQCRLLQTIGFEDMVLVQIEIVNNSKDYYIVPYAYTLLNNSESRSTLKDDNNDIISSIKGLSKANFYVCFPAHLLYKNGSVHVVVEYYLDDSGNFACLKACPPSIEHKRLDGSVFEIERPTNWKSLDDFTGANEEEAKVLVEFSSIALPSEGFPPFSIFSFRKHFPMFNTLDFGDWQCYIGSEEHKGLLVSNAGGNYGMVDLIYGRDEKALSAFVDSLKIAIGKSDV